MEGPIIRGNRNENIVQPLDDAVGERGVSVGRVDGKMAQDRVVQMMRSRRNGLKLSRPSPSCPQSCEQRGVG